MLPKQISYKLTLNCTALLSQLLFPKLHLDVIPSTCKGCYRKVLYTACHCVDYKQGAQDTVIKQLLSKRTQGRNRGDFPEKFVFIILQTVNFLIDQFPSFSKQLESLRPNLKEVIWSSQLLFHILFLLLLLAESWFPIFIFFLSHFSYLCLRI